MEDEPKSDGIFLLKVALIILSASFVRYLMLDIIPPPIGSNWVGANVAAMTVGVSIFLFAWPERLTLSGTTHLNVAIRLAVGAIFLLGCGSMLGVMLLSD